jgi:hypothetical protein
MESTTLLPMAIVALFVAFVATAFEMRASLAPDSCSECPHCRALALERAARQKELDRAYATRTRTTTAGSADGQIG